MRHSITLALIAVLASITQANAQHDAAFIARPDGPNIRVMTFNVGANSIFEDADTARERRDDGARPAQFARMVKALRPDVLCLQEILPRQSRDGRAARNAADVAVLLDRILPLAEGARWQAHGTGDNVIAARFPLSMQDGVVRDFGGGGPRSHTMALIDLPPSLGGNDLYAVCAHFQSRGLPQFVAARQTQAQVIVDWLRNGAPRVPTIVLGDFNAYKTDPAAHMTTLLTELADPVPTHNAAGAATHTFGDGSGRDNPPSALDRILFTSATLDVVNSFVLNTTTMAPEALQKVGMQSGDVLLNVRTRRFDHLPVVADFRLKAGLHIDLSNSDLIDLTHSFNAQTLYWPTSSARFKLDELAFGNTTGGWFYSSYMLSTPEHGGTHLDAPIHFAAGAQTADQIPLTRLIAPAVVVDISAQAGRDRNYRLAVADLERFEQQHGRIAPGTIVLLRTGFSKYWPNAKAYLGDDTPGDASKLSFPSYGVDAARLLVEQRKVAALGVDVASIDYGASTDFMVHRIANGANVPGFENLTNLDRLPATGAIVVALPMKIEKGSGGPLRAVAIVPRR